MVEGLHQESLSFICSSPVPELSHVQSVSVTCSSTVNDNSSFVKTVSNSTVITKCLSTAREQCVNANCPKSTSVDLSISNQGADYTKNTSVDLGLSNQGIIFPKNPSVDLKMVKQDVIYTHNEDQVQGEHMQSEDHVQGEPVPHTHNEDQAQSEAVSQTELKFCKCLYTNADQLRNKMHELELYVTSEDPDFIFVTEVLSKFNPDNISCSSMLFNLNGFSVLTSKDDGRGVIIYAKSELSVSPNDRLNSLYHDAVWCDWIFQGKKLTLGCIY